MTNGTWIYIPERDGGGEPWTGRIWAEGEQSRRWSFEAIRHAEIKDIYASGVFEGAKPVSVLLDHQRPATLIRPLVLRVDPGKVGTTHPFPRTRLEGSFQALLTGLAIKDEETPQFAGSDSSPRHSPLGTAGVLLRPPPAPTTEPKASRWLNLRRSQLTSKLLVRSRRLGSHMSKRAIVPARCALAPF